MGGASSTEAYLATELPPQSKFPFTVHKRFCSAHSTTLELQDRFWALDQDFEIKDKHTGQVVYTLKRHIEHEPKDKDKSRKWLVDKFGVTAGHMTETYTYTDAFDIHIGTDLDEYLTRLETKYIPLDQNPLHGETQHPITGNKSRIGCMGVWRQRAAFLYLDRYMNGGREVVAKIYRTGKKHVKFGSAPYCVEIAPGVDSAFIVLVCAAMDDGLFKHDNPRKKKTAQ